uniref:Ig-like domain-containing protein n=1 Tax=Hucho hucho TaxID=62062 RepID=A0A4W5KS28_9TELE
MLEQCLNCYNYYQYHSLSYIILLSFHLFHISVISSVVTTTSLQPREVAAPGSDITLSCSFPLSKILNLKHLVVNWQRGESEVVYSYYHGRDQLESVVYKGRTHLFEDQLTMGNASLRLSGVHPSYQGQYTCDVTDEQGSTQEKLQLLVAGKFHCSICDGFVVTLSASQGFPQPEVVWKGVMGSTNTTMKLDSKGLYELESAVTLRLNSTLTVTAELRLRVLDQSFTKSLTLHPPPGKISYSSWGSAKLRQFIQFKKYIHRFHNTLCALRPLLHHYHISIVLNPCVCIVRMLSCVCLCACLCQCLCCSQYSTIVHKTLVRYRGKCCLSLRLSTPFFSPPFHSVLCDAC